jgi:Thioesterase-like superfamily
MHMNESPHEDVPALFVPDRDRFIPTVYAVGPWRSDAVHGAAVAALFAAVLEEPGFTVARITMDLFASVRLQPLTLKVTEVEGGRRVRRRVAQLYEEERAIAQGTALLVVDTGIPDLPAAGASRSFEDPPAALSPLPASRAGWPGFESQSMALHTAHIEQTMLGWFRLLQPAIAERPITGLQMALAAADYTSGGTAMVLSLRHWTFVSTDLTVNLARQPAGEWIGLAANSLLAGTSIGVTSSVLHDAAGDFARCTQSQFIERRETG